MSLILFSSAGGDLVLPDRALTLVDRADGGHLIVNPPRAVWERSQLSADELRDWGALVAAAGWALLNVLPQLEGGCINYWEAGNWALHDLAEPRGVKRAAEFRQVHLHLLGRSPNAVSPSWRWGEAPVFPPYEKRHAWAAAHLRLTPDECARAVAATQARLRTAYGFEQEALRPWHLCDTCGYPLA